MLERAHRRTIQGLLVRCPKESIGGLLGRSTISDFITNKKLSFLISIAALPPTALPRQVLQCRLQEPHTKDSPAWDSDQWPELTQHCYPPSEYSVQELLEKVCNQDPWKSSSPTPVEPGRDKMRPRTVIHVRSKLLLSLSTLESDPLRWLDPPDIKIKFQNLPPPWLSWTRV